MGEKLTKAQEADALSDFLDALGEWGSETNEERAQHILDFIDGGFDLSEYHGKPVLRVIDGGRAALREATDE